MVLLTFSDLLQLIFEFGMGVKRMSLKQFDIQGLLIDYALNNRNSLLQVLHICTKMCFPLIIHIFILKPYRTTLRCFSRCVYLFPSLLEISTVVDGKRLSCCIILLEVQAHVCFSKSLFLEVPFCFKLLRSKYKIQRRCCIQIFDTFPRNHSVREMLDSI